MIYSLDMKVERSETGQIEIRAPWFKGVVSAPDFYEAYWKAMQLRKQRS
jgi:hypothetical protein